MARGSKVPYSLQSCSLSNYSFCPLFGILSHEALECFLCVLWPVHVAPIILVWGQHLKSSVVSCWWYSFSCFCFKKPWWQGPNPSLCSCKSQTYWCCPSNWPFSDWPAVSFEVFCNSQLFSMKPLVCRLSQKTAWKGALCRVINLRGNELGELEQLRIASIVLQHPVVHRNV